MCFHFHHAMYLRFILLVYFVSFCLAVEIQEKLHELIRFSATNRVYFPTTIRITSLGEDQLIQPYKLPEIPLVLDDQNHSISLWQPHERKNHSVSRYLLYNFIQLIPLTFKPSLEVFHKTILPSIDPRRDVAILIATQSELLTESVTKDIATLKLRNKFILEGYGDFGLWVEPNIFNGNMQRISSSDFIVILPPMGRNLRGRTIIAAAPETPPFNFNSGNDASGNAVVDGTLCRIFRAASSKFNFTPDIHYTGLDYGTLHPNGTWSGAYSKVHYPDSGFDMDLIVSNELLWTQLDVAPIATSIDMMFGIAYPFVSKHWYAFLLPFELEVWVWTIGMFIFLGIIQGITMYIINGYKVKPVVKDSTWFVPYAICMEQGLQDIPKGIRYFSLLLLMGCTVLGTGYKSTLRTHLMFPKPDPVPTTFDELADRTDFRVAVAVYGELESHFWKKSEISAVKKIRTRLTFEYDWEDCYKKAFLEQKRACISWVQGKTIMARRMTLNTTVAPMIYSKDAVIRRFLSLGFQENSMYVDSFYDITGGMGSMGIVMKWEEEIFTRFKKEGRSHVLKDEGSEIFNRLMEIARPQEDAVPLELDSLVVVLGFIPVGGLFGLVTFVLERYSNRKNKRSGRVRPFTSSS